ncbi:hypothetical protein B0H11DRAFT_1930256 [Mycena galericulata]|nr:hypothetical protein B0H11DRAFT_1930256 [Mycena galericulata]
MYQANITHFFNAAPAPAVSARSSPPQLQSLVHSDGVPVRRYNPDAGQPTAPIDVEHWASSVPIDVDAFGHPQPNVAEEIAQPALPTSPLNIAGSLEASDEDAGANVAHTILDGHSLAEDESVKADDHHKRFTCCICADTFLQPVVTLCIHIFCERCIRRNFRESFACPQCRAPITSAPLRDHIFETELEAAVDAGYVPAPAAQRRKRAYRWTDVAFPSSS